MKRGLLILVLGLLVAAATAFAAYRAGIASSRATLTQSQPELGWLKTEFNLTDAQFVRISELHSAYLSQCQKRCEIIASQNETLHEMLTTNTTVTPAIENLLAERARTRAECETAMLKHFLSVSQAMPPEQGRRYLAWVEAQTFAHSDTMESHHHQ